MTPRHIRRAAEGHAKERRLQLRLLAIHASWLLAPHLKKGRKVTSDDLLGEKSDAKTHKLPDAATKRRLFAEIVAEAEELRRNKGKTTSQSPGPVIDRGRVTED